MKAGATPGEFHGCWLTSGSLLLTSLAQGLCCPVAQFCLTFATPWTAACQASLSFTISRNLLKLMSTEWVMPSNHFILCCPLLLLPSIFPSIRVFSSESVLPIRWPKDCSFPFSISPSNEHSGFQGLFPGGSDSKASVCNAGANT